jgi:predicted dithiol-disulfide oxidoreductase (DUF899 family)
MITARNVVFPDTWLAARKALLRKEKEFTKLRDELSQARRDLPWESVKEDYIFEGPEGAEKFSDLFDRRTQLIVYHLMFAPEWDAACPSCSFWADSFDPVIVHLNHRDTSMVAVSRAPYSKLAQYEKRMGWSFKWLSSGKNSFNYDYCVSFPREDVDKGQCFYNYRMDDPGVTDKEGISVFVKTPDGEMYHTYSTYERGIDLMNTAYNYLDLTPKGRDEDLVGMRDWLRRHDEYDDLP